MKRSKLIIFGIYSYLSTLSIMLLNILPPFIRTLLFKIFLGKFGKRSFIDYLTYIRYFKNIEIGDNVTINRSCQFYTSHSSGKKILIGNNVKVAPNVKFYGARHDYLCSQMSDVANDIIIEDDCYICADCIILQGVTIGKGSVIGAGSVVTKDVPEHTVAVGSPCRVIKNIKRMAK